MWGLTRAQWWARITFPKDITHEIFKSDKQRKMFLFWSNILVKALNLQTTREFKILMNFNGVLFFPIDFFNIKEFYA